MPTVRKLTAEEVQTIEHTGKGSRKLTQEQYEQFLSEYEPDDYGEAKLNDDEKRLTVRSRLKAAATRRNLGVHFLRTTGNIIRFQVVSGDGQMGEEPAVQERAPEPVASDTPPTTKRGPGRPKKQAV